MALLLSQIGAPPVIPPRRWSYAGVQSARYDDFEEPIRALATGWQHVSPAAAPTGRWSYASTPVIRRDEDDELVRAVSGRRWHVSPAPTGRWTYARAPVFAPSDPDELPRVGSGHLWHVSPTVRFVGSRVVRHDLDGDELVQARTGFRIRPQIRRPVGQAIRWVGDELDDRQSPRWMGTSRPSLRARPRMVAVEEADMGIVGLQPHVGHAPSINAGQVRHISVRGNSPSGKDDYEESWFG